jgi:hypothetical protein
MGRVKVTDDPEMRERLKNNVPADDMLKDMDILLFLR